MKPLSLYHPALYWLRVRQKRLFRHIAWHCSSKRYARPAPTSERLPYRYLKHTSKLIRKLGDSDLALQHNKVINLKLAVAAIDGVTIAPGEYFSFCRLVGRPTRQRGYVEGMELSFGEARTGIGGGICQLSNLIHWMAIHSPLVVIERANHSFDPFPDDGRVLPFGSGAAIFYNYIDLVLHNPTDRSFQLKLKVGETQLEGELLCDRERAYRYHVFGVGHRFVREGERVYRENEIWREVREKGQVGALMERERLYGNRVVVKYEVLEGMIEGG
ncbi:MULTISPECIES: VanW family protein [unclassified Pseudomonas]|uniref:VanW family protein n=1 Tax=unclassified Pseudomonas TaxID=196821 RepID=UPI001C86CA07|nr:MULTISPECIES: VanW family protein [unclassified Pseudomonas]MBX8471604.1 VanW family protein [Pseudomonas sp. RIT778]UVM30266.1 VanW family protein [Pseudomonas sp. B21-021]